MIRAPRYVRLMLLAGIFILALFSLRAWLIVRMNPDLLSDVVVSVEDANHTAVDGADVIATLQTTIYGWDVDYICNRAIVLKTGLNGTITFPAAISEQAIWSTLIDRVLGKRMEMGWVFGTIKPGHYPDPPLAAIYLLTTLGTQPISVQTLVLLPAEEKIDQAIVNYERLFTAPADCPTEDNLVQNFRDEVVDAMIGLTCSAAHETRVSPEATAAFYRAVRPKYGRPPPVLLEASFFRSRGDETTTNDLCYAAKGASQ